MALVPKNHYKGTVPGKRKPTQAEQRTHGATTYAPGVRRRIVPEHGPIQIVVTWEYYSKNLKKWVQSTSATWEYKTLQAAMAYILNTYIQKIEKKYNITPTGKKAKEFYLKNKSSEKDLQEINKFFLSSNGYWKDGSFHPYDNADWDNGVTYHSQWIVRGGKYLRRLTFEQFKEVSTDWKRDYHDPAPNPWSHTGTVTVTGPDGRTSKRSVRTYLGDDAPDTTLQRKNARSATKRAIVREYDEQRRHELAMSPEEYAVYKDELMSLPDEEWQKKYGRNDRIVDYL